MNRVVRWDPFREMVSVRNQMDELVGDLLSEPTRWQGSGSRDTMRMPLDVFEDDQCFNVKASLPGIDPDNIEISFSENTLTVQGEYGEESGDEHTKWHLRERHFGKFMRSITLPASINGGNISADFTDGVLTLTLPKADTLARSTGSRREGKLKQRIVPGRVARDYFCVG